MLKIAAPSSGVAASYQVFDLIEVGSRSYIEDNYGSYSNGITVMVSTCVLRGYDFC